jgi:hypothetical protein
MAKALTKQAAASALVSAKSERQIKRNIIRLALFSSKLWKKRLE